MNGSISIGSYIANAIASPLALLADHDPWDLTALASGTVALMLTNLGPDYQIVGNIAVHQTAIIEPSAMLTGPLIIGPLCFVARDTLLHGGCWLAERCMIGSGVELRSSFLFSGVTLAHYNLVGDSVLGTNVYLEAGSIVANFYHETANPVRSIQQNTKTDRSMASKFGAMVGDDVWIGANAVVTPGTLLHPRMMVPRLSLVKWNPVTQQADTRRM